MPGPERPGGADSSALPGMLWMLGLTAVIVAEKTARGGRGLVTPLGVALLLAALVVAVLALPGSAAESPVPGTEPAHHHL